MTRAGHSALACTPVSDSRPAGTFGRMTNVKNDLNRSNAIFCTRVCQHH